MQLKTALKINQISHTSYGEPLSYLLTRVLWTRHDRITERVRVYPSEAEEVWLEKLYRRRYGPLWTEAC